MKKSSPTRCVAERIEFSMSACGNYTIIYRRGPLRTTVVRKKCCQAPLKGIEDIGRLGPTNS